MVRPTAMLSLLLLSLVAAVSCFQTTWAASGSSQRLAMRSTKQLHSPAPRSTRVVALAKKKSKARKPTPAKPARPAASMSPMSQSEDLLSQSPGSGGSGSSEQPSPAAAPLNSRLDDVLRNAGVTRSEAEAQEAARSNAPLDPLSKIPKKGQELLERFFGGGAIIFGSAFILSGIAVSIEAVCKVTGNALPTAIDEVLVQYVEPAMTPAILILFGFSISLGLLKQLQLGSESTGVLYTEPDDD